MHTGRLHEPQQTKKPSKPGDVYLPCLTLCKIWVFADFRGIPALGNCAIDLLHEYSSSVWTVPLDCVPYVYSNTQINSKLRSWFIHWTTLGMTLETFQATDYKWHTVAFLHDVMPKLTREGDIGTRMGRARMTAWDRCQWHDHSGPGGQLRLEVRN